MCVYFAFISNVCSNMRAIPFDERTHSDRRAEYEADEMTNISGTKSNDAYTQENVVHAFADNFCQRRRIIRYCVIGRKPMSMPEKRCRMCTQIRSLFSVAGERQ